MLIAARVLQGAFGALRIPQGFGLIRDMFREQVGTAFAAIGPSIGLATILGPVVAGMLVHADLLGASWRMIFLINVVLGAWSLIVGSKVLPSSPPVARGQRLDVSGALLAAAGVSMLVFPLVQGRELGWHWWSLALIAASVPTLATFVWHHRRRAGLGATARVELSMFAKRSYASGVLFVVVFFGAIVGFSLAVGLYLQLGKHQDPLQASLTMAPWAVGAFLGTTLGNTVLARLGRDVLHLGLGLMVLGLLG